MSTHIELDGYIRVSQTRGRGGDSSSARRSSGRAFSAGPMHATCASPPGMKTSTSPAASCALSPFFCAEFSFSVSPA